MFKIDLDKAKEIHKDNLRKSRFKVFKDLDIEFMKSLEIGDHEKILEISKRKQKLRDITVDLAISSATTVNELKETWDEDLLGPSPY